MSRLTTDEVLQTIVLHGEITRGRLAEELRSNKQTVRHHLRCLLEAGSIVITRETQTHASSLKWYGPPVRHAAWRDQTNALKLRLYKSAEAELKTILDAWGAWTHHRMPDALLEDVDQRIAVLPPKQRTAIISAHEAATVWRNARIDHSRSYAGALKRLLPYEKRGRDDRALLGDRCQTIGSNVAIDVRRPS